MKRFTPQKLLNVSLVVVFVALVFPLYVAKGLNDSLDHARGTGTVGGIDFKAYYIAADMLRTGKDFYDVEQQKQEVEARGLPPNESFYIYPPLLAILFLPLTTLPIHTAAQVWFFLNLILYVVSLVVLWRTLDLGRLSRHLGLLCTLAFLFPPALFTLYKGQVNILVLLLLALTLLCYKSERPILAGLFLGLGAMVKLMPLLLLLYFMWRRKTAVAAAALATVLLIGIAGLILIGIHPHLTYLTEVMPSLTQPHPNPSNQSIGGFFSLLFTGNDYTDYYVNNLALWKMLTVSFSLAAIACVTALCSRDQARPPREDLEIGLVVTTMPLVASIAWVDTLVILVLPYAALLALLAGCSHLSRRSRRAVRAGIVASVLLVSSPRFVDVIGGLGGSQSALLRNPLLVSLPFYGLLILWMTYVLIMIGEGAPPRASHV